MPVAREADRNRVLAMILTKTRLVSDPGLVGCGVGEGSSTDCCCACDREGIGAWCGIVRGCGGAALVSAAGGGKQHGGCGEQDEL